MKKSIACLSDPHGDLSMTVPQSDYLVISGDILPYPVQHENELSRTWINDIFVPWCDEQPVNKVIFIAGNHDFYFDRDDIGAPRSPYDESYTKHYTDKVVYLFQDSYEHDGLKFYGSPWTPWFWNWAFNFPRDNFEPAQDHWERIPSDTDILLTHGPPAGILDNNNCEGCGCPDLLNRVGQLSLGLHVFGHIHEGFGMREINNTTYCNASYDLKKPKEVPVLEIDFAK